MEVWLPNSRVLCVLLGPIAALPGRGSISECLVACPACFSSHSFPLNVPCGTSALARICFVFHSRIKALTATARAGTPELNQRTSMVLSHTYQNFQTTRKMRSYQTRAKAASRPPVWPSHTAMHDLSGRCISGTRRRAVHSSDLNIFSFFQEFGHGVILPSIHGRRYNCSVWNLGSVPLSPELCLAHNCS